YPGDKLIIPAPSSAPAHRPKRVGGRSATTERLPRSVEADPTQLQARVSPAAAKRRRSPPLRFDASIWRRYASARPQRGLVTLRGNGRNYTGIAKMSESHVSEETRRAFRHVLFDHRNGEEAEIAGRLVRLLVQVSETFGGRPINVVSGYRRTSFAMESRHLHGAACDLWIEGVPNLALF